MSEQNIYKEHYDLQQAYNGTLQSLQNIYSALYPHVAPEGVQLTLQEVLDLTLQKLVKVNGADPVHKGADADKEVAYEAEEAVKPSEAVSDKPE